VIVDKSTVICRAELLLQLQQHCLQLQKRAQELVRMDDVAATIVAMSVNNPAPTIPCNGTAIPQRTSQQR